MAAAVSENAPRSRFAITGAWVVALGMALLAIPTIATLGEQVWSKESGAHGPIVLVTGLVAISLFYIYLLRNASWRYSLFLVALVIPIAIVANIIRIVVLVLLTYFFGDAVAQGFLHMAAGIFLFVTALLLVFAVDNLMSRLLKLKGAAA